MGGGLKGKSRAGCYEVVVGSILRARDGKAKKEEEKKQLQVSFLLCLPQDLRGLFT